MPDIFHWENAFHDCWPSGMKKRSECSRVHGALVDRRKECEIRSEKRRSLFLSLFKAVTFVAPTWKNVILCSISCSSQVHLGAFWQSMLPCWEKRLEKWFTLAMGQISLPATPNTGVAELTLMKATYWTNVFFKQRTAAPREESASKRLLAVSTLSRFVCSLWEDLFSSDRPKFEQTIHLRDYRGSMGGVYILWFGKMGRWSSFSNEIPVLAASSESYAEILILLFGIKLVFFTSHVHGLHATLATKVPINAHFIFAKSPNKPIGSRS